MKKAFLTLWILCAAALIASCFVSVSNLLKPPVPPAATRALDATGMSHFTPCAVTATIVVEDAFTAFDLYPYYGDEYGACRMFMERAADTPGWHIAPITAADYAAALPDALKLLLPECTFDAWFDDGSVRAYFDEESGLLITLTGNEPNPEDFTGAGLTVKGTTVFGMERGFHMFRALTVPEAQRQAVQSAIAANPAWHGDSVTHAEYQRLINYSSDFPFLPELWPNVDFDAWYFTDDAPLDHPDEPRTWGRPDAFPAAMTICGQMYWNWTIALYDADAGLLVYFRYDA